MIEFSVEDLRMELSLHFVKQQKRWYYLQSYLLHCGRSRKDTKLPIIWNYCDKKHVGYWLYWMTSQNK